MATLIDYEPNVGGAASVLQAAARVIQQAEIERLTRLAENPPMAQTNKERQEALRARRLMLGMTEVRGIYLHPDQHAELKAFAKKLAKRRDVESRKSPAETCDSRS